MAKVSKTNPFRPRGKTESSSNAEGENKDEEKSSSSSDSEKDAQVRREKAKGKRLMHAKRGSRRTTLFERISGRGRARGSVTKRGRGKSVTYTARLWSSTREPRPRSLTKGGRGKSAAYTFRLWSKYHPRSQRKGVEVSQISETDSEEVCNRIKVERRNDDDTDNDGPGGGTHGSLTSFGIQV